MGELVDNYTFEWFDASSYTERRIKLEGSLSECLDNFKRLHPNCRSIINITNSAGVKVDPSLR